MIHPGGVTERLPTSGNRFDNSDEEAREVGDVVGKPRFGPVHTVDSLAHVVPQRAPLLGRIRPKRSSIPGDPAPPPLAAAATTRPRDVAGQARTRE